MTRDRAGIDAVNEPPLTLSAPCGATLLEEFVRYGVTVAPFGVPVPDSE